MVTLATSEPTCTRSGTSWRRATMDKRKRRRKITAEEQARFDERTREIDARIAERRARERAAEGGGTQAGR
jgi:hypothetical protein